MKRVAKALLESVGVEVRRIRSRLYRPLYSPWMTDEFQALYQPIAPHTLVSADRCYVLHRLMSQALSIPGDFWECGVYRGGTALFAKNLLRGRKPLYLFDTFEGMPETYPTKDLHVAGDFSDTSLAAVRALVGDEAVVYRQGFIPKTFAGLEDSAIAFAHIDVDIYESVLNCAAFIWPRLARGGFMVFDDYGFPSCPGAKEAVDSYFANTSAMPVCLPTGQALVFKS